jgi:quercetin dioxygenase-like cupin family protein
MRRIAFPEEHLAAMQEFPEFMKQPANRIASGSQATPGVEGYVFDGADGSQMAFWTCSETTSSAPHVHKFDEYMIVVQGCYTLNIEKPNGGEDRIPIRAGEECFILRGVWHGGEVEAGTRTIHAFGGHRANRVERGSNQ